MAENPQDHIIYELEAPHPVPNSHPKPSISLRIRFLTESQELTQTFEEATAAATSLHDTVSAMDAAPSIVPIFGSVSTAVSRAEGAVQLAKAHADMLAPFSSVLDSLEVFIKIVDGIAEASEFSCR